MGVQHDGAPPTWTVRLRRRNGRFVRDWPAPSKYAAKQIRIREDARHDSAFYTEIRDPSGNVID